MAPTKNKVEINPWGWTADTPPENVETVHILKSYRIIDFKRTCDDTRRNCRRNPFCYLGLGEKKWVQDGDEDGDEDDDGFREEGEFAGLQNLGATCYVNSLLQLWYHNPILRPAILLWKPNNPAPNYSPNGPVAQLQAMFARMKVSKKSKIDPTNFVKSLKLDTGEQQDAQEFSKLFMDVIIKRLTEHTDGVIRDSVINAFLGELQNETECKGCGNKTHRQESFNELELGVRKNLNESLDELLKDELLSGSDQYYCSNCNSKNDAIRRTKLLKLPPVLNFQLMRFIFDRETYRKKKVNTSIQFPELLDMSSRILQPERSEGHENGSSEQHELIYHLCAVLVHNGQSASSGHYVAQIKDLRTGTWHKFNDENVDRVGKAKSQKLVLKEDEGSGSDTEKKTKKKGNGNKGNHRSEGAYMLVYTLDRYVKSPEPDPDLWSYLENLVKNEDEQYEEEIKKTKNDKEYEISLKEQRKREISTLYPKLQIYGKDEKPVETNNDNGTENSPSSEDFEPPKNKIAKIQINGVCKPSVSDSVEQNGINHTVEIIDFKEDNTSQRQLRPRSLGASPIVGNSKSNSSAAVHNGKQENPIDFISKYDFISMDWMQQWLDATNPPAPMENKMLCCEHGKLRPPSPNSTQCLYKAVPSIFADILYSHYTIDGPRFQGMDAFCLLCVTIECTKLRKLQGLENDYKAFLELNKQFDSSKEQVAKAGETCWLSKEVLKSWKRYAKDNIEKEFNLSAKQGKEGDQQNGSDTSDTSLINSELICSHKNLSPNESTRKLIPLGSWGILTKYFPDAVFVSGETEGNCPECLDELKGDSETKNRNKEKAQMQKAQLNDIYNSKNRPDINKVGSMFVVSLDFVSSWRKFIREPTKISPIVKINNAELLCEHDKYKHPFRFLARVLQENDYLDDVFDKIFLIRPDEWIVMKNIFTIDKEIELKVNAPFQHDLIEYSPEVCSECATDWAISAYKQKFDYKNQYINIVRRSKDGTANTERSNSDDDGNSTDLFEPIVPKKDDTSKILYTKRERKRRDPSAWKTSSKSDGNETSTSNGAVRRSTRPRRQRGEKSYKVSSTLTVRELKLLIMKDFNALLSDQHLFFGSRELTAETLPRTLGELQIPSDSTLFLEIDTETKSDADLTPISVETGFRGTLLMGDEMDASSQQFDEVDPSAETETETMSDCSDKGGADEKI